MATTTRWSSSSATTPTSPTRISPSRSWPTTAPGTSRTRLAAFLRSHGIEPQWHYHPWDITSVALGYACGRDGQPPGQPWKSDQLANLVGINTAQYARHTAMGDVLWTLAQWDLITGRVNSDAV